MRYAITVKKINEAYIRVESQDSGIIEELSAFFTFEVPNFRFTPQGKSGAWDGKIRLFSRRNGALYAGLFKTLKEFCEVREYELIVEDSDFGKPIDKQTIDLSFIEGLNLHAHGEKITPQDYQLDAIKTGLSNFRTILLSPTSSGKSLIIYCIIRWFLANEKGKILLMVPNVSLVNQFKSDLADYSSHDEAFDVEKDVHCVFSGQEKDSGARVILSTWQSIQKLPYEFYKKFGMIILDEAHSGKGACLTAIMEKAINVKYRIGTTGTLDKTEINPLVLTGLFGPIHRVITTKELIDRGTVADIKIKVLQLKYSDEEKKAVNKVDYQAEIDYIVTHKKRNDFISNLVIDQKKNSLVLFNFVDKHGKVLYELIRKKLDDLGQHDRKVFYISGETEGEDREVIRKACETESNAILVASYATCSTGISIRNLHNVFFTSPTKSFIRVLQSIGRGLRKHGENKVMTLFDIADDFSWKKKRNFALKHAIERMKMYAAEKFGMKVFEIDLNT